MSFFRGYGGCGLQAYSRFFFRRFVGPHCFGSGGANGLSLRRSESRALRCDPSVSDFWAEVSGAALSDGLWAIKLLGEVLFLVCGERIFVAEFFAGCQNPLSNFRGFPAFFENGAPQRASFGGALPFADCLNNGRALFGVHPHLFCGSAFRLKKLGCVPDGNHFFAQCRISPFLFLGRFDFGAVFRRHSFADHLAVAGAPVGRPCSLYPINSSLPNNGVGPSRLIGDNLFGFTFGRRIKAAIAPVSQVCERAVWPAAKLGNKVTLNAAGVLSGQVFKQLFFRNFNKLSGKHFLNDAVFVSVEAMRVPFMDIHSLSDTLANVERSESVLPIKSINIKAVLRCFLGHCGSVAGRAVIHNNNAPC